MKDETFTEFILNKLNIANVPLVVQEVVVKDLGEVIMQRSFIEMLSGLNEDDSKRLSIYIDASDFDGFYGFLTADDAYEKKFSLIAHEVVEDFKKQLHT